MSRVATPPGPVRCLPRPRPDAPGGLAQLLTRSSCERVVRLAGAALHVPIALVAQRETQRMLVGGSALPGTDFTLGAAPPAWLALPAETPPGTATLVPRSHHDGTPAHPAFAAVDLVGPGATILGTLFAIERTPSDGDRFGEPHVACGDSHIACGESDVAFGETHVAFGECHLATLADLAEAVVTELTLRHELSQRLEVEQRLRHDSLHDGLTSLPNRTLFLERLGHAIARARRRPDYLYAVLFLDLDRFKVVNDSLGHQVGDQLLIAVARRLERCLRSEDTVARLGGDEFAILLENIHHTSDAGRIAERIQGELLEPVNLNGYDVFTSVSIGIVDSSGAHGAPDLVLRSADMAMYRAKATGKARYEMFDLAMHAEALARLQLETDLRHAFERNEFRLVYQPIVSLELGRMIGVEALLRWTQAERGIVAPGEFVPLAEEMGLILPLGRWVLTEACAQMGRWRAAVPHAASFAVCVNLSVKQFAQPDLAQQVAAIVAAAGIAPTDLTLEVTESVIVDNPDQASTVLRDLKQLGVELHMDDFGTGYSSLSYLTRFPMDAIKIDRAFVSRMEADDTQFQLVRTILTLARSMNLRAVAEGVETPAQLLALRKLGCEYAQGFLFSEPLEADQVEQLIRRDPSW